MQRLVDPELKKWKNEQQRLPLIIRGARQVGKSYSVENLGKEFDHFVSINFEEQQDAAHCFATLDIQQILKRLALFVDQPIVPGKTLLFLDEIELCPQALKALRYFKEKLPELHVIAAGSLLEFILEEEHNLSFPVGRAQFFTMLPLSFIEFFDAIGQGKWKELLSSTSLQDPIPQHFHERLLKYVKEYFLIGGMPNAVSKFIETNSYLEAMKMHRLLIDFYRLDLAKYGKKKQLPHLLRLFERAPEIATDHFKYSKIDPESPNSARDYKQSLNKLIQARLIHPIFHTSANGLPLKAEKDEKKFKLLFLDIGLLQSALGIDPELFFNETLIQVNRGSLAEQFVGQEILSYGNPYLERELFFWEREKSNSTAEVDFLLQFEGNIIPIEVKAGKSGRLRSIKQFLATKPARIGIRISEAPLSYTDSILSVPFYLISELPRLIRAVL